MEKPVNPRQKVPEAGGVPVVKKKVVQPVIRAMSDGGSKLV
jgi:hypothetical protein